MATPVTSALWTVSFKRSSVTDQRTFSITVANSAAKAIPLALAAELKKLGFVEIDVVLTVVLP